MHFQRFFLFLIFSVSLFLLWDGWQRTYYPQQPTLVDALVKPATQQPPSSAPAVAVSEQQSPAQRSPVQPEPGTIATNQAPSGQKILVKTDFLQAEITTVGGNISRMTLLQHRGTLNKDASFVLFDSSGTHTYLAQTGLLGPGLPTHNSLFKATASEYQLLDGQNELEVVLRADEGSARVSKVYRFHRGSYLIDVTYRLENAGANPLVSSAYFQLVRDDVPPEGDSVFVPTYTGPAIYTEQEKFQKVPFSDIEESKAKHTQRADNGWVGMLQHYFVSAWLPAEKVEREYFTRHLGGNLYSAGAIVSLPAIAPGQSTSISVPLYVGPAQASLDKIAAGLGLTVDYGWLTIIATPIFWLLSFFHGWAQNWGVAIILLTVLIKLAFFPLSAASYKSMAKLRVVAPRLERIKQQYGSDREQLHKAMMELYKTEKINPLGGCLPILIQIPVFIALYWSILASVELRYAPFFGWITDLSATDPYYVLPVLMGISMYIQTKLNPVPPDPLQAKLMQIMPIAFSLVFFFFPAGLVLYSIVNNVLSIAQQWYITKNLQAGTKGAGKA